MHAYRDMDAEHVIWEFCAENDRGLAHANFFKLRQVFRYICNQCVATTTNACFIVLKIPFSFNMEPFLAFAAGDKVALQWQIKSVSRVSEQTKCARNLLLEHSCGAGSKLFSHYIILWFEHLHNRIHETIFLQLLKLIFSPPVNEKIKAQCERELKRISTFTVASLSSVSLLATAFEVASGVFTSGIRVTVMATIIALINIWKKKGKAFI